MMVNTGSTTVADRRNAAVAHLVHLSTGTVYNIQFLKDKYERENGR
jgi:hypothetical protein